MLTDSQTLAIGDQPVTFDLLINAVGYEERAGFSLSSGLCRAEKFVSFLFQDEGLFSYRANFQAMRRRGSQFIPQDQIGSETRPVSDFFSELLSGGKIRVGVDISSMNRTMIASILRILLVNRRHIESLRLIYSPATFRVPDDEYPQIQQIGPVIPELSGHDSNPSLPIGLLIGLGYEFGIAVGIMNRLEPKLTIAFRASGNGTDYEEAVRRANFNFEFGLSRCEVSDYSLIEPHTASIYIEDVLYSMVRQYRCILVPMGPKLLSAIFILAGFQFFGQVAVWRVSEAGKVPRDAFADGRVVLTGVNLGRMFGQNVSDGFERIYGSGELGVAQPV